MNLKLHELKTAAMFSSVSETRPATNGVRFIHPGRLVSTDGRILVVIETEVESEPLSEHFLPFTLKSSVIDKLPDGRCKISVTRLNNDAAISIHDHKVDYLLNDAFIDVDYPNYHQVIPEQQASEVVPVNGAYFSKIERAAELFSKGRGNPVIWSGGPFSPLEFFVEDCPNFYGILMALRKDQVASDNPLSLKLKAERKAK